MSSTPDLCSSLGLTGISQTICKSFETQPITLQLLYTMYEIVKPKLGLLTTGYEGIIRNNLRGIIIQNIILNQLPWLIAFVLLLLILWSYGVITGLMTAGIMVLTFFTTVVTIVISLLLNRASVYNTVDAINAQTKYNFTLFFNNLV